jgi:hypothetical protein
MLYNGKGRESLNFLIITKAKGLMAKAFLIFTPLLISISSYACEDCGQVLMLEKKITEMEKSHREEYGACDASHFQRQITNRYALVYNTSTMFSEKLPHIYSQFIEACKSSKCKYKPDGSLTLECLRTYNILFDENKNKISKVIPKTMAIEYIAKSKRSACSSDK